MIYFNHLGRLGYLANQMFQYAAIRGIAKNRQMKYTIPDSSEMQLFDGFEMKNCGENFGFLGDLSIRDGRGAPVGCKIIQESGFAFDEKLFKNCPSNVSLYGFFQTEKYFLNIKDEILEDFEFKKDILEPCKEFISSIKENDELVSIHIRRGDYGCENHPLLGLDYFEEAIKLFPSSKFLLFSDSIDWVKEQKLFSDDDRFMISETKDGKYVDSNGRWLSSNMQHWNDLCLQSLCDHNIISNSTFGWWSAYLNKNKNKKVVSPNPQKGLGKWFGKNGYTKDLDTSDLLPNNWIKL